MNRDDIIRMAREVGVHHINLDADYIDEFERFAALVAAHERDACAKVADQLDDMTGREIAANIRARGEV